MTCARTADFVKRRPWWSVTSVAAAAVLMAGCSAGTQAPAGGQAGGRGGGAEQHTSQDSSSPQAPAEVTMRADPADGSSGVKVDRYVEVRADGGTLTSVSLTGKGTDTKGAAFTDKVKGSVAGDQQSWKASSRLEPGAKYTVTMVGTNAEGTKTTTKSSFTTQKLTLKQQTYATVSPVDKGTYGVAMPVVVKFDVPVKDKKNVEKHLKVTSSSKQEGGWNWLSSTEVHYRPREYWKPGTTVHLDADLNSVNAGGGVYGQQSRKLDFTVGKSVVTTVNLKSHKATVKVNGKTARTISVSGGKPGFTTRSGTKVITEKLAQTKMRSETVGIAKDSSEGYDLDVKYAMRITNSGEFLHAAPWNSGNFGVRNASHGCVGMSTADASWLFGTVRVGDPVTVTGTDRSLEAGNGLTDWEVGWSAWQKGSALN